MTTGTIVILVLLGIGVVFEFAKHGEEKAIEEQYYNGWAKLFNYGWWLLLLWWAGNFG